MMHSGDLQTSYELDDFCIFKLSMLNCLIRSQECLLKLNPQSMNNKHQLEANGDNQAAIGESFTRLYLL